MKVVCFFVILFLGSTALSSEQQSLNSLKELQWKHRVIIFNTTVGDAQINDLKTYADDIDDRDIVWLIIHEDRLLSNYAGSWSESLLNAVRADYSLDDPSGVLIGKDGGVKARFTALDLQSLFRKIDAMPMRQAEIKKSKNTGLEPD